jgi:hypothetical protein
MFIRCRTGSSWGPSARRRPGWRAAGWLAVLSLAACASQEERPSAKKLQSAFETDPAGASIFIDGGFVGTTPTSFHLPPKRRVALRLELPGYFPIDTTLDRAAGTAADAEEGVGWDAHYFFPLQKK